jgi:hypothetical protein
MIEDGVMSLWSNGCWPGRDEADYPSHRSDGRRVTVSEDCGDHPKGMNHVMGTQMYLNEAAWEFGVARNKRNAVR